MKTDKKQQKFFEVVLKLIHVKGFKATTMRDIAKEMNFEVANVYNYIPSKQNLLDKFILEIATELDEGLTNILNSSYKTVEKIEQIIAHHCKIIHAKPYHVSILLREARNLKGKNLTTFTKNRNEYFSKVEKLIAKGIKEKIFKKLSPQLITRTIVFSICWAHTEFIKPKSSTNPIELEKQLKEFFLKGLLK